MIRPGLALCRAWIRFCAEPGPDYPAWQVLHLEKAVAKALKARKDLLAKQDELKPVRSAAAPEPTLDY